MARKGNPGLGSHPSAPHPEAFLHKGVDGSAALNRGREKLAHHDWRERHGRGALKEYAKGAPHEEGRTNAGRSAEGVQMVSDPWRTGSDASYIEPRLMPDYELLPRDDSGGPEYQPYTQEWGDGGYVTGMKAHLSAMGGSDDPQSGDEQLSTNAGRSRGERGPSAPSSSSRMARK